MNTRTALIILAVVVGFLWVWVGWIARNLPKAFDAFGTIQDEQVEKVRELEEDVQELTQQVQELLTFIPAWTLNKLRGSPASQCAPRTVRPPSPQSGSSRPSRSHTPRPAS